MTTEPMSRSNIVMLYDPARLTLLGSDLQGWLDERSIALDLAAVQGEATNNRRLLTVDGEDWHAGWSDEIDWAGILPPGADAAFHMADAEETGKTLVTWRLYDHVEVPLSPAALAQQAEQDTAGPE